jgi:hypothetical protein
VFQHQATSTQSDEGADESITALFSRFEKAETTMRAISEDDEKAFERAVEQTCALGNRIVTSRATSIEEMLFKIRVAIWAGGFVQYGRLEEVDHWEPDEDCDDGYRVLASLRRDLQALASKA